MEASFTPKKILIIDPTCADRLLVQKSLDGEIYNFFEAKNINQGIYKARVYSPDLIIIEPIMSTDDGFELIKILKRELNTAHIPIFILTNSNKKRDQLKGLRSGAEAYLQKPFNPEELRIRITNTIENRILSKQHYEREKEIASHVNQTFDHHPLWAALTSHIYAQIENPSLSVNSICKHLGISERQLRRKLSHLTDKSLTNYILSIRLEYAKKILSHQQVSIAEVAYMTGFSSPSNFTRAFKKTYGIPPSQLNVSDISTINTDDYQAVMPTISSSLKK